MFSIQRGEIRPNARPDLAEDRGIAAIVDGAWTFGQISASYAAEFATASAKERVLCLVALQRAITSAASVSTRRARRLTEWCSSASDTWLEPVAPYGGKSGALASNPFSIGFPDGEHTDFMLDFATSMIAAGKVMVAGAKHEQLPPGLLLDLEGNPTRDPDALLEGGALVPSARAQRCGIVQLVGDARGSCLVARSVPR